jgi:hypothetical protein
MIVRGTISRAIMSSVWLIAWGLALCGVLNISRLDMHWDHGICGPWGCGPPPQALAACHLFWLVLLAPPMYVAIPRVPPALVYRAAWTLAGLGILGLVGIVAYEFATWLPEAHDAERRYFVHRCLFSAATLVEVPLVEMLLLGFVMRALARIRKPGTS